MLVRMGASEVEAAELAALVGLTSETVSLRQRFLRFGAAERGTLVAMRSVALPLAGPFIDELYAHLNRFDATSALLVEPKRVARLKRSQQRYFEELFEGDYGLSYALTRLRVGMVHQQVQLAPQYYLGTYSRYLCTLLPAIGDLSDSELTMQRVGALLKLIFFDAGIALDAYLLSKLQRSMGPDAARGAEQSAVGDAAAGDASQQASATRTGAGASFGLALSLNSRDIGIRRDFVGVDAATETLLRGVAPQLLKAVPRMIDRFYEQLRTAPTFADFFARPDVVERLSRAQRQYWHRLLRGPYDRAYAANRVSVGQTHERIDLDPHWYLGGICVQLLELLPDVLAHVERPLEVVAALVRVLFFDISFVLDAYLQARFEELLRSEGYAAMLVAKMPVAVLVVDRNHRIEAANRQALEVLGVEGELLLGSKLEHVLPTAQMFGMIQQVFDTGEEVKNVLLELATGSTTRSLRMNALPLSITKQQHRQVAVMLDDLTELRRKDATISERVDWLSQLVENLPGLVWQASADSGHIQAVSGRVKLLTGYSPDQWMAEDNGLAARIPSPDRERWDRVLSALGRDLDCVSLEHDLRSANDAVHRFRSEVRLVRWRGQAPVLRGVSIDVSEECRLREQLQQKLRDEEMLGRLAREAVKVASPEELYAESCSTLRQILGCNGVIVVERDADSCCRIRATSEEVSLRWVSHESKFPSVESARVFTSADPEMATAELMSREAERAVIAPIRWQIPESVLIAYWSRGRSGSLGDVGKTETVASLLSSACRRKLDEDERRKSEKLEALGTLAAGVAHDFNNVLQSLGAQVEELKRVVEEQPAKVSERLEEMRAPIKFGSDLVRQILTFVRPGLAPSSMDLDQVARRAVELARISIEPSGIILVDEIDSGTHVAGDVAGMEQLIVNLLLNAAKASSEGSQVHFEVFATHLNDSWRANVGCTSPGDYAVLRISDSGSGIAPEDLDRIFDPFFTTRPHSGGTGLGMVIVRNVAEAVGGAVDVSSEPGKGTTISVYLPATQSAPQFEGFPARAQRVLLVEDNTIIAQSIALGLDRAGYSTAICSDGEEALALLRQDPSQFDIVITDQGLPGMTGESFASTLRGVRPNLSVVMVTGDPPETVPDSIDLVLSKPISVEFIAQTLKSLSRDVSE